MASITQQLEAAQKKAEEAAERVRQLKALQTKKDEAARKKADEAARKLDARKKLLLGVAVLGDFGSWEAIAADRQMMAVINKHLTRPSERALFGLGPAQAPGESPTAPAAESAQVPNEAPSDQQAGEFMPAQQWAA